MGYSMDNAAGFMFDLRFPELSESIMYMPDELFGRIYEFVYEDDELMDKLTFKVSNEDGLVFNNEEWAKYFQFGRTIACVYGRPPDISNERYVSIQRVYGYEEITVECYQVTKMLGDISYSRKFEGYVGTDNKPYMLVTTSKGNKIKVKNVIDDTIGTYGTLAAKAKGRGVRIKELLTYFVEDRFHISGAVFEERYRSKKEGEKVEDAIVTQNYTQNSANDLCFLQTLATRLGYTVFFRDGENMETIAPWFKSPPDYLSTIETLKNRNAYSIEPAGVLYFLPRMYWMPPVRTYVYHGVYSRSDDPGYAENYDDRIIEMGDIELESLNKKGFFETQVLDIFTGKSKNVSNWMDYKQANHRKDAFGHYIESNVRGLYRPKIPANFSADRLSQTFPNGYMYNYFAIQQQTDELKSKHDLNTEDLTQADHPYPVKDPVKHSPGLDLQEIESERIFECYRGLRRWLYEWTKAGNSYESLFKQLGLLDSNGSENEEVLGSIVAVRIIQSGREYSKGVYGYSVAHFPITEYSKIITDGGGLDSKGYISKINLDNWYQEYQTASLTDSYKVYISFIRKGKFLYRVNFVESGIPVTVNGKVDGKDFEIDFNTTDSRTNIAIYKGIFYGKEQKYRIDKLSKDLLNTCLVIMKNKIKGVQDAKLKKQLLKKKLHAERGYKYPEKPYFYNNRIIKNIEDLDSQSPLYNLTVFDETEMEGNLLGIWMKHLDNTMKLRIIVSGDSILTSKVCIKIRADSKLHDTIWYVLRATHHIDVDGYFVEMELMSNAAYFFDERFVYKTKPEIEGKIQEYRTIEKQIEEQQKNVQLFWRMITKGDKWLEKYFKDIEGKFRLSCKAGWRGGSKLIKYKFLGGIMDAVNTAVTTKTRTGANESFTGYQELLFGKSRSFTQSSSSGSAGGAAGGTASTGSVISFEKNAHIYTFLSHNWDYFKSHPVQAMAVIILLSVFKVKSYTTYNVIHEGLSKGVQNNSLSTVLPGTKYPKITAAMKNKVDVKNIFGGEMIMSDAKKGEMPKMKLESDSYFWELYKKDGGRYVSRKRKPSHNDFINNYSSVAAINNVLIKGYVATLDVSAALSEVDNTIESLKKFLKKYFGPKLPSYCAKKSELRQNFKTLLKGFVERKKNKGSIPSPSKTAPQPSTPPAQNKASQTSGKKINPSKTLVLGKRNGTFQGIEGYLAYMAKKGKDYPNILHGAEFIRHLNDAIAASKRYPGQTLVAFSTGARLPDVQRIQEKVYPQSYKKLKEIAKKGGGSIDDIKHLYTEPMGNTLGAIFSLIRGKTITVGGKDFTINDNTFPGLDKLIDNPQRPLEIGSDLWKFIVESKMPNGFPIDRSNGYKEGTREIFIDWLVEEMSNNRSSWSRFNKSVLRSKIKVKSGSLAGRSVVSRVDMSLMIVPKRTVKTNINVDCFSSYVTQ